MKTTIKIFSFLLLLFGVIQIAAAQEFKVIASKGKNMVGGASLKVGAVVKAGSTIVMEENGYLGLHYTNGKTVELKNKGSYAFADLEKQAKTGSASVNSKYLAMVAEELTKEDEDVDANRQKHMGTTGAVTRSLFTSKTPIVLMMPKTAKVYGNEVLISWILNNDKTSKVAGYRITVKDLFGNVLLQDETATTSYTINLNQDNFRNQQALIYQVAAKGSEDISSEEKSITRLSAKETAKLNEELTALGQENTAISKVVLAQYFEEKKLFPDAIKAYVDAIQMAPEVRSYKRLYDAFLNRIPSGE